MRRPGGPLLVCLCVCGSTVALAQPRRDARLVLTVVDQSNAVIPGVSVTVTGADETTKAASSIDVITDANGIATMNTLTPGRYGVSAVFPGFEPGGLKDLRVRSGDNRHVVVLVIERHTESVSVGQDPQTGASDRKGGAFGTALTREQLDALSDDPNEMQRQLQEMAGPGAVIRIDSFEGGTLPPKSQIKAIHITRDQFAAENHSSEGVFIDIITQPGVGPIRTGLNYQAHSTSMTARNPLSSVRGADQVQNYGLNVGGGLIRDKASFSLAARGFSSFDTPVLKLVRSDGAVSDALTMRAPRDQRFYSANVDYAVTPDQTLRVSYSQNDFANRNLGIGGFNDVDRSYSAESHTHTFRVQEAGPMGRRFFTNTRLNVGWSDSRSRADVEAVTIRVLDAFTAGGAQVAGGRHSRDVNLASDLDYVRGYHSVRAGIAVDANWFHSDDTSNYLGTYTFENLAAYEAGQPRSFVKRIGNPNLSFGNLQAAGYVQDDIRVRKSVTATVGLRYEVQSHMQQRTNVGPRLGATWAPLKNGKMTLRASWGRFFDWLSTTTFEQTLRVDGYRQQEVQVLNPSFPATPVGDVAPTTGVNRYLLAADLVHPVTTRTSAGWEYAFTQRLRVIATYRYSRGSHQWRGDNQNAPIEGVRPDPRFGNVVAVESDARSRQHQLQLFAQTPPPGPPVGGSGPRWDWKRWGFFSGYTLSSDLNNTDGPFATPATGRLEDDWGPTSNTSRHRIQAGFTSAALRNVTWQLDGQFSSGTPYTIRTGFDDNADLIFIDRPVGAARNSERGAAQLSINLFAGYTWTFGRVRAASGGPTLYGTPAGVSVATFAPPPQGRYRVTLAANVQNMTNHANYTGYTGTVTSPLFRQPSVAINPRRLNIGLQVGF